MKRLIATSSTINGRKIIKLLKQKLRSCESDNEALFILEDMAELETLILASDVKYIEEIAKEHGLN